MLNECLLDTLEGGRRRVIEGLVFPSAFPTKLRHLKYSQLANSGATRRHQKGRSEEKKS